MSLNRTKFNWLLLWCDYKVKGADKKH